MSIRSKSYRPLDLLGTSGSLEQSLTFSCVKHQQHYSSELWRCSFREWLERKSSPIQVDILPKHDPRE
jgi:hypothetical protein